MGSVFWQFFPLKKIGGEEHCTKILIFHNVGSLWLISRGLLCAMRKMFSSFRHKRKGYWLLYTYCPSNIWLLTPVHLNSINLLFHPSKCYECQLRRGEGKSKCFSKTNFNETVYLWLCFVNCKSFGHFIERTYLLFVLSESHRLFLDVNCLINASFTVNILFDRSIDK